MKSMIRTVTFFSVLVKLDFQEIYANTLLAVNHPLVKMEHPVHLIIQPHQMNSSVHVNPVT